jgi:hypothetical protein
MKAAGPTGLFRGDESSLPSRAVLEMLVYMCIIMLQANKYVSAWAQLNRVVIGQCIDEAKVEDDELAFCKKIIF